MNMKIKFKNKINKRKKITKFNVYNSDRRINVEVKRQENLDIVEERNFKRGELLNIIT